MHSRLLRRCLLPLFGAAATLCFACYISPGQVGSRYVKSLPVKAAEGATLTVSAAESPELAGTQLVIEPGALSADQTITVELGLDALVGSGAKSAGPVATFGPDGLVFQKPAKLTLPLSLAQGEKASDVFVQVREGNGTTFVIPHDKLDLTSGTVAFAVKGFTSFQPASSQGTAQDAGPSPCQSNSDCVQGEVCAQGTCVAGQCASDADCQSGLHCFSGLCTGNPQCQHHSECPQGDLCVNGACTPPPYACTTFQDCPDPNGMQCVNGACVGAVTCQTTVDCPQGDSCISNVCRPSQSGGCATNLDCSSGQVCNNGVCQTAQSGCTTNADCASNEYCSNGQCRSCLGTTLCDMDGGSAPVTCTSVADCQSGEQCINGVCAPIVFCNSDADCSSGQTCAMGYCQ